MIQNGGRTENNLMNTYKKLSYQEDTTVERVLSF